MPTNLIAIDPGNVESAVVRIDGDLFRGQIMSNESLIDALEDTAYEPRDCHLAIEMIASYGMAVGKEVFETCLWIGRFIERWSMGGRRWSLVYRKDVKMNLCGSMRAKDANIRQALIDRFGPKGTKKNPGRLYGFKSHMFAALAVGVTWMDQRQEAA